MSGKEGYNIEYCKELREQWTNMCYDRWKLLKELNENDDNRKDK